MISTMNEPSLGWYNVLVQFTSRAQFLSACIYAMTLCHLLITSYVLRVFLSRWVDTVLFFLKNLSIDIWQFIEWTWSFVEIIDTVNKHTSFYNKRNMERLSWNPNYFVRYGSDFIYIVYVYASWSVSVCFVVTIPSCTHSYRFKIKFIVTSVLVWYNVRVYILYTA